MQGSSSLSNIIPQYVYRVCHGGGDGGLLKSAAQDREGERNERQ